MEFIFQVYNGFLCASRRLGVLRCLVDDVVRAGVVKLVVDDLGLHHSHFLDNLLSQVVYRGLYFGIQFNILSVHFAPNIVNVFVKVLFQHFRFLVNPLQNIFFNSLDLSVNFLVYLLQETTIKTQSSAKKINSFRKGKEKKVYSKIFSN